MWVRIKDIAISELGKTLDKGKNSGELNDYLCALNVKWGAFDLTTVKQILLEDKEKERYLVRKGDLLICEGGDVGRAAIWENEKEIYYQNALHRVRFKGGIDQYFYLYALQYYKHLGFIDDVSGGVTIKHFTQNSMQKLLFPLPPLTEQKRIADSIVQWFALIDEIEANKKDLQEYIKQTKSKVLDLAIHGKLVPQDPNDEPAIDLLKRINPSFKPCDTSHYENLPETWCVVQIRDIAKTVTGSTPSKNNKGFYGGIFPFYKPSDLDAGRNVNEASEYLSEKGKQVSRVIPANSIAVCCIGSIGKCGYIMQAGTTNQQINTIIPFQNIYPLYIYYFCLSTSFVQQLLDKSSAVTIAIVNKSKLDSTFIPIPPLSEQKRIVERIETIFAQLDTITAEL